MPKSLITCKDCEFKSACFQQLDDEELTLANENKVQVVYKKGETILKQGSFVTHILYVKEGIVKVYRENEDDTNTIFNIHSNGSLIGLSSLFYSEIIKYSIAALSDTKICAIDKNVIQQITQENDKFGTIVIQNLNREIDEMKEKMVSLTLKQLNGRLADSLLYLADKVYGKDRFKLHLSRRDLAEFSGMSTMSVVRTMQHFIKSHLIEEKEGELNIIDKLALEEMAIGK